MPTHTKWLRAAGALVLTLVLVTVCSNRARAGEFERIRVESAVLHSVMAKTLDRSATFRRLVEQVEQSDVIVYLTCERFDVSTLSGRTALTAAQPGVRYLRVQIDCQQRDQPLAAILAHELQHVVEIASAASVVDRRSFARLFSEIGFAICRSASSEQYETMAALHAGERVRREWMTHSDLNAQASDRADRRASARAD